VVAAPQRRVIPKANEKKPYAPLCRKLMNACRVRLKPAYQTRQASPLIKRRHHVLYSNDRRPRAPLSKASGLLGQPPNTHLAAPIQHPCAQAAYGQTRRRAPLKFSVLSSSLPPVIQALGERQSPSTATAEARLAHALRYHAVESH